MGISLLILGSFFFVRIRFRLHFRQMRRPQFAVEHWQIRRFKFVPSLHDLRGCVFRGGSGLQLGLGRFGVHLPDLAI